MHSHTGHFRLAPAHQSTYDFMLYHATHMHTTHMLSSSSKQLKVRPVCVSNLHRATCPEV